MSATAIGDPVGKVLGRLKGVRRTGRDQWDALCPAHDDHKPSLWMREADDGTVLLHCFAGCDSAGVLQALGLKASDLFPHGRGVSIPTAARIVAQYPYRDEAGNVLYEVVRYEPKNFRQRRPDGKGGWLWNLDGTRRVLYRLPELLAKPDDAVVIAEGEKDVHSLGDLGFVATCNSGGAGKWRDEYSETLRGRIVSIIADADEAGRRHAQDVARSLHGKAERVAVVEMPNGAKDATQWIEQQTAAGRGREDIQASLADLLSTALEWTLEAAKPLRAVLRRMSEVKPEPIQWLWPGRIALGKLTLLIGDPNVGKSLLALDIAARVTRGKDWPDKAAGGPPGGVVIVSAEDDPSDTIRPRLDAAGADAQRVTLLEAVLRSDSDGGLKPLPFCLEDLVPLEEAIAATADARVVIVDPISAYLGRRTDSHRNSDVRAILAPLAALAAKYRVAVLAVSHLNKGGAAAGSPLYRATGSLAFTAAARSVLLAGQHPDDQDRRVLLPLKNNLARELSGLGYAVRPSADDPAVPVIAWESGAVDLSPAAVLGGMDGDERLAVEDAADWLREVLADGPVESNRLQEMAKANGHAWRTVRRATDKLGVVSEKQGFGVGAVWHSRLPDGA